MFLFAIMKQYDRTVMSMERINGTYENLGLLFCSVPWHLIHSRSKLEGVNLPSPGRRSQSPRDRSINDFPPTVLRETIGIIPRQFDQNVSSTDWHSMGMRYLYLTAEAVPKCHYDEESPID